MGRRRTIASGVVAVALAGGVGVALTRGGPSNAAEPPSSTDSSTSRSSAKVEQRDLVRSQDLDGVVGHGAREPLRITGNGTITGLPAVDDVLQFGQPILEIDGEPVVLLPGARPAWRSLGTGITKGEDIRQLEAALVILGYADPDDVGVDDTWTSATTAAVKALQKLLGMPEDGRLDIGEVVFATDVLRVSAVAGSLGDSAGEAGIEVTGLDQSIGLALNSSKVALVAVGDSVEVELPSGDVVDGTVAEIGGADVGADGSVTFPVVVTTDALDVADGVPVTVTVDVVAVQDATAVPAEALLALAEGGYAVEVPDASSATGTRLVGVDVGAFADGWVQVTGDVAAGDTVVVP